MRAMLKAQSQCTGHGAQIHSTCTGHRKRGTGHRARGMGYSNSAHPVEVIVDGLKEDAAQHGASLAALVPMLVDEGAEAGHGGRQVLVQVEVGRNLDCHLVSLQMQELVRLEVGGAERAGSQGCVRCAIAEIVERNQLNHLAPQGEDNFVKSFFHVIAEMQVTIDCYSLCLELNQLLRR